jgi:hypothetical protein
MSNPVIWFEVMGQDADKFSNFYGRRRRTTDPPSDLRETGAAPLGVCGFCRADS